MDFNVSWRTSIEGRPIISLPVYDVTIVRRALVAPGTICFIRPARLIDEMGDNRDRVGESISYDLN